MTQEQQHIEKLSKHLLQIEVWAEGLRKECHTTRLLIAAGVSTSARNQKKPGLTGKQIATVLAKRKKYLLNRPKTAVAG